MPNAGVPILGEPGFLNPAFPTGIVRHLIRDDEAHLGPPGTVRTSQALQDGVPTPQITRDLYWDAEQLVEAIAQRVVAILDERYADPDATARKILGLD